MSLKSKLANLAGISDLSPTFTALYTISFFVQRLFDTNDERKKILSIVRDYTHVNYARLRFLWDVAERVQEQNHSGAFVETGVWKGGCAGILSHLSKKRAYKNALYFFDSFEGLPEPTEKDGLEASKLATGKNSGKLRAIQKVSAGETYIRDLLFIKLQIDESKVHLVKGWFQDTLPIYKKKIGKISILRLDGDWYESTKVALDNLYDCVVSGGYVVIDDYYFWDGCKKAVDDFILERKLQVTIRRQDASGAYFIKP